MLFGRPPWNAMDERDLTDRMFRIPVQFPHDARVSKETVDFIRRCLSVDEHQRLSMQEID